jgi:EAL domain-containing protein (putative c-di-GMP-specific phosphodiesterase class I)
LPDDGPGLRVLAVTGVDAAVAGVGLSSVFQPVVSLADETVVGFEALTRWSGLDLSPPEVFAHAHLTGALTALNQRCIDSAITAALHAGMPRDALLLINTEPTSPFLASDGDLLTRGRDEFRLVFELTERHLLQHPRALLRTVAALRSENIGIALDDVGAHPDSLALLDVVLPDVVKLDLALVQSRPNPEQVRTVAAVLAHRERTGALILAEGIETDQHLERALALGATLGQGFRFGHPAPLRQHPTVTAAPAITTQPRWSITGTPFDLTADTVPVRPAAKSTLLAFSRHIETQAQHCGDAPIVLTALQDVQHFTGATRTRYEHLAAVSPLVAVFGQRLPADLGHGLHSVALDPGDPLCREWSVITLGPHTAAALLGREIPDPNTRTGRPGERHFDLAITYNRRLVTVAARNLLNRIP